MLNVRLLSLVIFSSLMGSQANGMFHAGHLLSRASKRQFSSSVHSRPTHYSMKYVGPISAALPAQVAARMDDIGTGVIYTISRGFKADENFVKLAIESYGDKVAYGHMPTDEMEKLGKWLLSMHWEDPLLDWCNALISWGINPNNYFPCRLDKEVCSDYHKMLLVSACSANMPKVIECLLTAHKQGFDCWVDIKLCEGDLAHTLGDLALEVAELEGHNKCAELMQKYLVDKPYIYINIRGVPHVGC